MNIGKFCPSLSVLYKEFPYIYLYIVSLVVILSNWVCDNWGYRFPKIQETVSFGLFFGSFLTLFRLFGPLGARGPRDPFSNFFGVWARRAQMTPAAGEEDRKVNILTSKIDVTSKRKYHSISRRRTGNIAVRRGFVKPPFFRIQVIFSQREQQHSVEFLARMGSREASFFSLSFHFLFTVFPARSSLIQGYVCLKSGTFR